MEVLIGALPGLGSVLGLMTVVWVLSLIKNDVSIVDIFLGLGCVARSVVRAFGGCFGDAMVWWGLTLVAFARERSIA